MVDPRSLACAALLSLGMLAGSGAVACHDDRAEVEARQLSTLAPAASRDGLRLRLRAANGRAVHFDSRHPQDDAHQADVLDSRLAGVTRDGKFFVVSQQAHESETLYWVSRATGDKTEIHSPPEVSPNGRYAVTALHWESFGPQGVFVWEIAGDRLLPRAHLKNANYGLFTFRRWIGNDAAELELYSHSFLKSCPRAQATTAIVRLSRSAEGWKLTGPAAASDIRCE